MLPAVFWLSQDQASLTTEQLLLSLQATQIRPDPRREGRYRCRWGNLHCETWRETLNAHQVFFLYFLEGEFIDLLLKDNGESLAQTFRQSCLALYPEVAYIITRPYQAAPEWSLGLEIPILAADANRLADERFGLLYLNEAIAQNWTGHKIRDDRDSLPAPGGKLVFAARGEERWV